MEYLEILDNFWAPIIGNILYIAVVFGLRIIFPPIKDREQRAKISSYYDKYAALHNFILTLESLFMCLGMLNAIYSIYLGTGSHWGYLCDEERTVRSLAAYKSYRFWQKMYYYSKYHETLDTVLVVLKRGQVTVLAIFHHSIMIHTTYWGNFPDMKSYSNMWFPTWLNTVIHIIMYSYFTVRSLGVKDDHPLVSFVRENITRMQILQFILILIYSAPFNPYFMEKCDVNWRIWGWCFVPVFLIMLFFINFYIQQYIVARRKTNPKKRELINFPSILFKTKTKHSF
eukprot:TRINITY_DN159_c0_g2_i1.p1 TRINITY_DN159_c0_g2~~TRINITY_DN159_c0_g2_i1.p1  ORF type:complete len:285 (+),score=37.72 TRINITY_DN159_c0_g2_i1:41-895(+)